MKTIRILLMQAAMPLALTASLYVGFTERAAQAMQTTPNAPSGKPEATIDLATDEGAKLVNGQWRYSDTRISEIDFRGPGPALSPRFPVKSMCRS